jgi:hypothetical protein
MENAITDASVLLRDDSGKPRPIPAADFFWGLAEACHWLRLTLTYCEGYGYSLAHLNALADIWASKHEITDADLDTIDRSVAIPDLETTAHLMSNIQYVLGLHKGPEDTPTLDDV